MVVIKVDRDDSLHYVSIQGLEKTKKNEKMATKAVCRMLGETMLTQITLNNWKGNVLLIRYATNRRELSILFDAIKSDVALPENHDERSLLY